MLANNRHDGRFSGKVFSGEVARITFFDASTNYTVAKLKTLQGDKLVTLVGKLPKLAVGQPINVWGNLTYHPKYGQNLQVQGWEAKQPADTKGIQAYLSSDLVKGVGPVLAERIIKKFGQNTMQILEKEPQKLAQVKGITKAKAQKISRAFSAKQKLQQAMISLQGLDLSLNLSQKIIDHYQEKAVHIVKRNPYQLTRDLMGVGFLTADKIAKKVGFTENDPRRITAVLTFCLQEAQKGGHVFLPKHKLFERASKLIGQNASLPVLRQGLSDLVRKKRLIVEEENRVYLETLLKAEEESARLLKRLINSPSVQRVNQLKKTNFDEMFVKISQKQKLTPVSEQKRAVISAILHPVSIVSGGPGTGKSTIVRLLLSFLSFSKAKVTLCAPTGRAAKRLAEVAGQEASTIHRLLKIKPGKAPEHNASNPLSTDFVVVDEVSMLDLPLFHQLLSAISPGTHLLLVGDTNQLPSVGPGNVLKDLVESKVIPTVFLRVIFRQSEGSQIIKNAHRINKGDLPLFLKHPTDFYLFAENETTSAAQTIVELVSQKIPQNFGIAAHQIQVLSPVHKGAAGVIALNKNLQQKLNPPDPHKQELDSGQKIWREGDKVLQLSNNYEKEVFNGDLGFINKIKLPKNELTVSFEGQTVNYSFSELAQLSHAFAMTIHKSQGSEFETVVMPILTSHYVMLERNLVYTAVTRAKKLLVLVGSKKALYIAIKNNHPRLRYTNLLSRLVKSLKNTSRQAL